jgi:hypothetical protein
MGEGITAEEQENCGSSVTPAAAAADKRINSRRESMVFLLGAVMAEWFLSQVYNTNLQFQK